MMKRETLFLKLVVILIGIPILALCIFWLPWVAGEINKHLTTFWLYPALVGLYGSTLPFFAALYQAFKLLTYMDKNHAFSELSVTALRRIKYCAITICILQTAVIPLLYMIAELDDAPGLIIMGLIIPFASLVIAVFAAVLQKLLNNAIDIKTENDLTV
ncbi:DUF2975 domain-containing protein [Paenibacillus hexagrammi]|uniref:DUF2975 domain-containing protein n=1 Tax=Paenibacillus hexagrammi TaxID=2908839 RepID=A0ABY3SIS6_9BACL|nr:DUF2975 domain-containing protein [Paenibacillus sp. YPD9-1]UJF33937.1 DUF2975 domain-containing protein [Paenibacillus sp. YPD9-1]